MGQMKNNWKVIPPFHPEFDLERCAYENGCAICAHECSFGEIAMKPIRGSDGSIKYRPWANLTSCGACQRCVKMCPENAIHIRREPMHTSHNYWTNEYVNNIWKQSGAKGGVLLVGNGSTGPQRRYFDHLLFDACQVTNPSIDPLREPMEIRTYLGRKPEKFGDGIEPLLKLEIPIMFGAMSSARSTCACMRPRRARQKRRHVLEHGEGGFTSRSGIWREYPSSDRFRAFWVSEDYLNRRGVEIKVGQGAKPVSGATSR
jgi:ferredoxin